MQNNVIYGAFGQTTRAPIAATDSHALAPAGDTPFTLRDRISAQRVVLSDLAELINEPTLPQEIANPLREDLRGLQMTATTLADKISRAHTNDQTFLEVQGELKDFSDKLIDFETTVLHKTGAEIELVQLPPQPALAQVKAALGSPNQWVNNPKFWIGASVGVAALGGFLWWVVAREKPAPKEDFTKNVTRVKLRRAMPAR